MNKTDLISLTAENTGLTKKDTERVVNAMLDAITAAMHGTWIAEVLSFVSLNQRFTPFTNGQLSFANMLYGMLFMFAMMFLCVRTLDARRWNEV